VDSDGNHIGHKVIGAKTWKNESPKERDAHLRNIKAGWPPYQVVLIVTVPDGEVWLIANPHRDYGKMNFLSGWAVREWTEAEKTALPVAVPRDKKVSQSDRRGTIREPVAKVEVP
jgi:hypothetical protein